jgi:uncharacterized Tic20 family protein
MNHDEKNLALICHLSALAMFVIPFGNVIGPLIVWLMKKDSSPFIDAEGKEVLNFQITVTIGFAIAMVLSLAFVGIPLLIAIGVGNVIFIVLAAIEVSNGNPYRYPINLRLIK